MHSLTLILLVAGAYAIGSISPSYLLVRILKGIDLSIGDGEVHAIMGPNGSGKSTLSYALAGRDGYDITEGEVIYKGQDLPSLGLTWASS